MAGHHPVHGGQDSLPAYLEDGLVLGQRVRRWRAIGGQLSAEEGLPAPIP